MDGIKHTGDITTIEGWESMRGQRHTYKLLDSDGDVIDKHRCESAMKAMLYFDRCGYLVRYGGKAVPGLKIIKAKSDFSMNVTLYD